jgi:hypothetical protein
MTSEIADLQLVSALCFRLGAGTVGFRYVSSTAMRAAEILVVGRCGASLPNVIDSRKIDRYTT